LRERWAQASPTYPTIFDPESLLNDPQPKPQPSESERKFFRFLMWFVLTVPFLALFWALVIEGQAPTSPIPYVKKVGEVTLSLLVNWHNPEPDRPNTQIALHLSHDQEPDPGPLEGGELMFAVASSERGLADAQWQSMQEGGRGFYVADHPFDHPGLWWIGIRVERSKAGRVETAFFVTAPESSFHR